MGLIFLFEKVLDFDIFKHGKKLVERRMYEKKAQKIIERLSEETVNEATLASLARFIESYHYDEIVEERFLSKLCGYPICGNELTNIPAQKYRISTISNKVYDITDRKRFCSGDCFKASKCFSSKISTVPIWSRNNYDEDENNIQTDKKEIKVQISSPNDNDDANGTQLISKSNLYSNEIEKELNLIEQEWKIKMQLVEKKLKKTPKKQKNVLVKQEIDEHPSNKDQSDDNEEANVEINKNFFERADQSKKILDQFVHLKKSEYLLARIFDEDNIEEKFKEKTQLIEYLLRRLDDLLSVDAKNYIKNEKNEYEQVQRDRERIEFNQKYLNYQSKSELQNLDSDDDLDDSQEVKANDDVKKPLPYYEQLKKEAQIQQLKIKEFFRPSIVFDEEDDKAEEDADKNYKPIILPEVDSISQKQIRQRIFFEKLFKNIESLLKYSNFNYKVINVDLKNHVKNFISVLNLTNENLIFKSNEWPIISIIILEMMGWKFRSLHSVLSEDRFIKTLLNALNLDYDKLKRISEFLINI